MMLHLEKYRLKNFEAKIRIYARLNDRHILFNNWIKVNSLKSQDLGFTLCIEQSVSQRSIFYLIY